MRSSLERLLKQYEVFIHSETQTQRGFAYISSSLPIIYLKTKMIGLSRAASSTVLGRTESCCLYICFLPMQIISAWLYLAFLIFSIINESILIRNNSVGDQGAKSLADAIAKLPTINHLVIYLSYALCEIRRKAEKRQQQQPEK